MPKTRNPIIITTLSTLILASACHRLPLSIGEGLDDAWHNPDGSGSAGTGAGGATGGAPGLGECDALYLSCLESGEDGVICRGIFDQCAGGSGSGGSSTDGTGVAGAAGTGSGGAYPDGTAGAGAGGAYPDGTGAAGAAGTGSGGAYPDGTAGTGAGGSGSSGTGVAGAAGSGSGGAYPDGTGAAGAGGYPANGGAAGGSGLDECNTTYVLCLESGESPEICRDEFLRCEVSETGAGAAGAAGN